MSFDLDTQILSAKLSIRQSIRRNAMLAKTAIHLEAEKVRDDINCLFDFAEVETELSRFQRQFKYIAFASQWRPK